MPPTANQPQPAAPPHAIEIKNGCVHRRKSKGGREGRTVGVLAGGGVGGEAAAVRGGGGGRVEVGGDRAQPALRGVVHWRRGLLVLPWHWRWTPCVAWGGGEVELRKRTRNTRVFSREGESLSVAIKALGLGASGVRS